jgi:hypothetical protein
MGIALVNSKVHFFFYKLGIKKKSKAEVTALLAVFRNQGCGGGGGGGKGGVFPESPLPSVVVVVVT